MYKVQFYKKATKSLRKIPRDYQAKIREVSKKLSQDPFALDIQKLHPPHKTSHRLRIGDYRLFLDIDTTLKVIIIVTIERRTTQTYI